jgi:hypothetical protein
MHEAAVSTLKAWETFYVIVGSSAGALTGLQFVVMTLIAEGVAAGGRKESISAFGTPNVVHFCEALLVASILSAPWGALRYAGVAIALCGLGGLVYSVVVLGRALRQSVYKPVFEDWLWHTALPMLAYAAQLAAGIALERNSEGMLFVLGGATLLLVFIGIHNAWDTVTFVLLERGRLEREARKGEAGGAGAGAADGTGHAASAGSGEGAGARPRSRTPGPSPRA